ncbi:pyruvate kinase [Spirochaetota bacterium]
MKTHLRKTKIVCTIGPATAGKDAMEKLFQSGMNVARLNFSHGNYEEHLKTVKTFKGIRAKLKIPVGLLLDTRGPEIRLKKFKNDCVELTSGKMFTLTPREVEGTDEIVSITYKGLAGDVSRGDRILIDDGLIELKVVEIENDDIHCDVINGGTVSNRKGVNIPNVIISLPFVSDRDREDILFGIKNGFDFIAASFVRDADCVKEIRMILEKNKASHIKIISKIENRGGVDNIDDIIRVSDGIMVARGDMGVEIPFEELPEIQKQMIRKCNIAGKVVITATQMLESMIKNPRPTRAEITDVANAIYDGTSGIMLSGETSIGKYPVETLKTMSKIAVETEGNIDYIKKFKDYYDTSLNNVTNAISYATCAAAHNLDAKAIISVTKSGHTARMVARYRPGCQIIAPTILESVFYQLSLSWGVLPILTNIKKTFDGIFNQTIKDTAETGLIENGDLVLITCGLPAGVSGTTNTLMIRIVGDVLIKGIGANKLSATGNVCVIDEDSSKQIQFNSGDVIVIGRTTNEIMPLLKYAAAIITEEGEDSDTVVIGKTLEIPVVTNAVDATRILKNGTVVNVDSSSGIVSRTGDKK